MNDDSNIGLIHEYTVNLGPEEAIAAYMVAGESDVVVAIYDDAPQTSSVKMTLEQAVNFGSFLLSIGLMGQEEQK